MLKQQTEHVERAAGVLVEKLLPVLDNFDLALAHGEDGVDAVYRSLMNVLEAEGLEKLDPVGKPFDPNEHDAVVHEPAGDDPGGDAGPSVSEVLRPGYRWKGRLLRPAMVKVRG
jgi:molecular chaperone GrpE